MLTLARGQKQKLADLTPALQIGAQLRAIAPGLTFDFSCFGVDSADKLSDDRYFVFFNQTSSPKGEISLSGEGNFAIDLASLPPSIQKLVFVITIDGDGTLSQLQNGHFSLLANSREVARFEFRGSDFANEKAIIAAEIYRKDVWRLAAVGQGFSGGLDALLTHFGGQQIEEAVPVAAPPPVAISKPAAVERAAPIEDAPKKVILAKADSKFKIDLSKAAGEITATAQWIDNGDRRSDNDDLDLRAGILFPDGTMSMVTCTSPGSLGNKPYVLHLGDVKSASRDKPGMETMKVNPQISDRQSGKIAIVFSIYSAIANGPVAIASLKPVMELQYGNQTVKCELDFSSNKDAKKQFVYTYVIGLAIINGKEVEISPGGQVSPPSSEATPWLEWDYSGGVNLTFTGPAVLKGGGKFLTGLLNAGNSKRYV